MITYKFLLRLQTYLLLLVVTYSCKTQKLLYEKKNDVVLIPNNSIFDTTSITKQYLSYFDPFTLEYTNVEFNPGQNLSIQTNSPTFFINYYPFLVYPGDSLQVSLVNGYQLDFKSETNEHRNKEYSLLKDFSNLWAVREENIRRQKNKFKTENKGNLYAELQEYQYIYNLKMKFLDSLVLASHLSNEEFGKIVRMFYEPDSINRLVALYSVYKDSLKKENLYIQKHKDLLPFINNLKSKDQILYGYSFSIEKVADVLLPKKIHRINNLPEFESCFDTATSLFQGVAKEYVLTKIMYTAFRKKIPVSNSYEQKYYRESKTKAYTSMIRNLFSEQKKLKQKATKAGSNALFNFNNTGIISLDKIIEENNGKVIVIDFWASWCVPCLEEIPHEKKLQEYFSDKEVIFLNISLDTEIRKWRNSIITNDIVSENNYVFANSKEASFIKKYNVQLIPRYMLFGKDGKIINDDAPRPSDPKLKELIDKLLSP